MRLPDDMYKKLENTHAWLFCFVIFSYFYFNFIYLVIYNY